MNELLVAACVTVLPAVVLLAVAYALRPQGGRRWLSTDPRPARSVVARLERERKDHPDLYAVPAVPAWTVPTARKLVSA